nr:cyclin-dependent kinase 11B-like [Macaca nemestrina]
MSKEFQYGAVKKMTFSQYLYSNLCKGLGALLSEQGFDLMNKFLTYFPGRSTEDGLKHEYFCEIAPSPTDPSMFPTWPAKSEQQCVK